jgi:hypothetical protein
MRCASIRAATDRLRRRHADIVAENQTAKTRLVAQDILNQIRE